MNSISLAMIPKENILRQLCSAEDRYKILQDYAKHSRKCCDDLQNELEAVRCKQYRSNIDQLLGQSEMIAEMADRYCEALFDLCSSQPVHEWILGDHKAWHKPISTTKMKLTRGDAEKELEKRHRKNMKTLREIIDNEKRMLELLKDLEAVRRTHGKDPDTDCERKDDVQTEQGPDPECVLVPSSCANGKLQGDFSFHETSSNSTRSRVEPTEYKSCASYPSKQDSGEVCPPLVTAESKEYPALQAPHHTETEHSDIPHSPSPDAPTGEEEMVLTWSGICWGVVAVAGCFIAYRVIRRTLDSR